MYRLGNNGETNNNVNIIDLFKITTIWTGKRELVLPPYLILNSRIIL